MMINVIGSLSAVSRLSKEFESDSKGQFRNFSLQINNQVTLHTEESGNACSIVLVNQDQTDQLLKDMISMPEMKAITFIDNGSTSILSRMLSDTHHISRVLGLQGHCYAGDVDTLDKERVFRLKQLRDKIDLSEIVLRTSDVAVFNMNAIRRGDQCTYTKSNTTGLTIEEACHIAKYIGASQLVSEVYFVGLNFNDDSFGMMTTNLVNLLWYYAEGLKFRNIDTDVNNPDNLVFSIVAEEIDQELQFIQSTESGRWWLKVPTEEGEPLHMACSHKDYVDARNNEFSDRVLSAISKVI